MTREHGPWPGEVYTHFHADDHAREAAVSSGGDRMGDAGGLLGVPRGLGMIFIGLVCLSLGARPLLARASSGRSNHGPFRIKGS